MAAAWAWLEKLLGWKAALLLVVLIAGAGLFGLWRLGDGIHDWWKNRQLEHVTAQRDEARAERDVARKDADTGEKTAAASSAARKQNDDALQKVRSRTAARVERIGADAEQLRRDEDEAVADYEAAAGGLRGAGAR